MPAFCPICARDEETEEGRLDEGTRYGLCRSRDHGPEPYVWEITRPGVSFRSSEGIGADLDIWDKLLECVESADFVPYGTVEERFIAKFPEEAQTLAERFGHRWRPEYPKSTQFSMSAYLAARLRELAKEGLLKLDWGPAEGPWSYNETISWWRRV
jgi:hypothetical protein